jgi:RNA polymerase sigma factor for flagellar operon FliA
MPLVKTKAAIIASRCPKYIDLDDLIGEGYVGLCKAVDRFDESKGFAFSTYASFLIEGAIRDSLRNTDWLPRKCRQKANVVVAASTNLANEIGSKPSVSQIAEMLCATEEEVSISQMDAIACSQESLYSKVSIDEDNEDLLVDTIADYETYLNMGKDEIWSILRICVDRLTPKEKRIIHMKYTEDMTPEEMCDKEGCCYNTIHQYHKSAILKLRKALKHQVNLRLALVA